MATLTWNEDGSVRAADLAIATVTTVGRRTDATIVVQNETVSRQHFALRPGAEGFSVENLSQSTTTRVGDETTTGPRLLADGESIQAGAVLFTFHDLARANGRQEVECSHCSRSNGLDRRDCWFCGTSMVNALTAGFKVARPLARLVSNRGSATLFAGESAIRGAAGALESGYAAPEAEAVLEKAGTAWVLGAGATGHVVREPGRETNPGEEVRHLEPLEIDGVKYVVLLKG